MRLSRKVWLRVVRHCGASIVTSMEFELWAGIDNFEKECTKLENEAWPDGAARSAFLKKMASYMDTHHSDEIYTVIKSMQK